MNHDDFMATDKILTSDLAISLIAPLNLLFKLSASAKPGLSTFSNDVFKDQMKIWSLFSRSNKSSGFQSEE